MMPFPNNLAILQHFNTLNSKKDWINQACFLLMSSYFHGGGGPSGVGIEVEFPFVILPVVLPAIVLPLTVWLPWIVVCASADIVPKFIDATYTCYQYSYCHNCDTKLETLLHVVLHDAKYLFKDYHKADFWSTLIVEIMLCCMIHYWILVYANSKQLVRSFD